MGLGQENLAFKRSNLNAALGDNCGGSQSGIYDREPPSL